MLDNVKVQKLNQIHLIEGDYILLRDKRLLNSFGKRKKRDK